jgi:hypothetical protein
MAGAHCYRIWGLQAKAVDPEKQEEVVVISGQRSVGAAVNAHQASAIPQIKQKCSLRQQNEFLSIQ